MTKSPYEIRLDILSMAQSQMNSRYYSEWEKAAKAAELSENKMLTEVPQFPTTEEILTEADKLKRFVDKG